MKNSDLSNLSICGSSNGIKKPSSVKNVKPCGSQILVEHLSAEDINESRIHLPNNASITDGAPQAYVLGMGPGVKPDVYGFNVGDRVLLQGNFVPVPTSGNSKRARGLVEPTAIKAVLEE